MKQIKALAFRVRICEYVHLALLALLYALPVALAFDEDEPAYRFAWALGTVLPALLIRFLCERTQKKGTRLLLCLAVIGLTMLVTGHHYHWTYYLLTTLPIAFLGSFFPKAKVTGLFTVPSIASLCVIFPVYAIGKVLESRQINMHTDITLILIALLVLNYLIHFSQSGLLTELRRSSDSELSVSGLIRQNRRTVLLFLLICACLLTLIPILMPQEQPSEGLHFLDVELTETQAATEPTEETRLPPIGHSEEAPAFKLDFMENVFQIFLAAIGAVEIFFLVFFLLKSVFARGKGRDADKLPEFREGLTIERLDVEREKHEREKLSGWEKKIRRSYEKLILERTRRDARLRVMTPAELEKAAKLPAGPETRTLHEIYEQTRYGAVPPTREDYARFKDCAKTLEKGSEKKKD